MKIFVGGVPRAATDDEFSEYFKTYGEIEECILMRDGMGMSRGFGFVICGDESTYETIFKNELTLMGKRLEQKKAVPPGQVEKKKTSSAVKLFIGGLPPHVEKSHVREFFSKFGEISEAVVMQDTMTGKSRGFGFITFKNENSAEDVLQNPHFELGGRMVQCKRAQPMHALNRARQDRAGRGVNGGAGRGVNVGAVAHYPVPVYSLHYNRPPQPVIPLMTGYGQPAFPGDGGCAVAPAAPAYVSNYGSVPNYSTGYGSAHSLQPQRGVQEPYPRRLQPPTYAPAVQDYSSTDDGVQSYDSQVSRGRYQPY